MIDAAAAADAVLHDLPDAVERGVDLGLAAPGELVLQHDLGHGMAARPAHVDQFARRAERERQLVVRGDRSEEHTSELQSLMRISYAVFCLTKQKKEHSTNTMLLHG